MGSGKRRSLWPSDAPREAGVRQSRLVLDETHGEKMPFGMKAKGVDLSFFAEAFHYIPDSLCELNSRGVNPQPCAFQI